MKPDFGASHDFGRKLHGKGELRISRTIYFKHKHLEYIADLAESERMNISEATDIIIQCGIAWKEQMKLQTTMEDFKNGNITK